MLTGSGRHLRTRETLGAAVTALALLTLAVTGAAGSAVHPPPAILASGPNPPDVVGMVLSEAIATLESQQSQDSGQYLFGGYETVPPGVLDPTHAVVTAMACRTELASPVLACYFTLSVDALVPELLGLTVAAAAAQTERCGLVLDVGGVDATAELTVAEQDPQPGTQLAFGKRVQVTLDMPPLPDLVGLTVAEAGELLQELQSRRQQVAPYYRLEVRTDPVDVPVAAERAFVIEQPSDCPPTSEFCVITLRLGASVPELADRSLPEAQELLAAAGLVLDPSVAADAAGRVGDQEPQPGLLVVFGSSVWVGVTPAGDDGWPPLPELRNITLAAARARLAGIAGERAGLVAGYDLVVAADTPPQVREDRVVVVQQPQDCAAFTPACEVVLVVRAVTPSLSDMTLDEARAALASAGLSLGDVAGDVGQDDRVVAQEPAAGELLEFGSPVSLQLAAAQLGGGNGWWWPVGVLAAAAAGAAAWTATHRRGRPWVQHHVRVAAEPGSSSETVRDVPAEGPSHSVRIHPETGPVEQRIEEVDEP